jgi:hypothetical protein
VRSRPVAGPRVARGDHGWTYQIFEELVFGEFRQGLARRGDGGHIARADAK